MPDLFILRFLSSYIIVPVEEHAGDSVSCFLFVYTFLLLYLQLGSYITMLKYKENFKIITLTPNDEHNMWYLVFIIRSLGTKFGLKIFLVLAKILFWSLKVKTLKSPVFVGPISLRNWTHAKVTSRFDSSRFSNRAWRTSFAYMERQFVFNITFTTVDMPKAGSESSEICIILSQCYLRCELPCHQNQ